MAVSVEWKLRLRGNHVLSEAALAWDLPLHGPAILAADPLYGNLIARKDVSKLVFDIEDEIEALILNVCIRPIAHLARLEPVHVLHFSGNGELHLVPAGDEVVVSGDGVHETRLPRPELMVALLSGAERYVDVLRRLESPKQRVSAIAEELNAAKAALG